MAADFIDWSGLSGAKYRYWFMPNLSPQGIKDQAGNYMFVRQTNREKNEWAPVYIGIADDLRQRLPNHEVLEAAKAVGATHAMTHTQADRVAREAEERDLIGRWNPQLNTHHRTVRRAG